jgi:hypothetical protein
MKPTITCLALAAAFGLMAIPPADAGSKKQSKSSVQSATEAAKSAAQQSAKVSVVSSQPVSGNQLESKPGPAYRTVSGTVKNANGQVVVMEDYEGKEVRMFVSNQTKKLRGDKKPGDSIRAELTHGGHANSIQ